MNGRPVLDSRRLRLAFVAGAALAAVALGFAAASGAPYLSFGELNPWIAVYAVGLFVALFATPFLIHASLAGTLEDDSRWERALLLWGAVSLGALVVGVLLGLPSGFSASSLAGSVGAVLAAEAALVLATLVGWLLSN